MSIFFLKCYVMFCYVENRNFSCYVMLCVMLSIFSLKREKCALIMRFVNSKGSGLKLTVSGQSERSRGVQLDGPNDLKWTVLSRSGRSKKLKVNGLRKQTFQREKTVRSWLCYVMCCVQKFFSLLCYRWYVMCYA